MTDAEVREFLREVERLLDRAREFEARLDEEFQAEEWGRVEEAIEMAGLRERAYLDAARLWTLLRQA